MQSKVNVSSHQPGRVAASPALPPSVSSRVGPWCAFLQLPLFSNVFIYPLIQGINQGQHTMPHTAIKIHCNANSPVASAQHWQVLTRRAVRKQPHVNTHTHIYQLTDCVNSLPEGVQLNRGVRVSSHHYSLLHPFSSHFSLIVHLQTYPAVSLPLKTSLIISIINIIRCILIWNINYIVMKCSFSVCCRWSGIV